MEAYVSWDVNCDDIYDAEGDVVGQEEYALIEKIWVPSSERGNGKGRQMLREAIEEIKAAGHDTVKIAALPFDDGMDMCDLVEFYESEGFDIEDTNGHAVIMSMDL